MNRSFAGHAEVGEKMEASESGCLPAALMVKLLK